MTISCSSNFRVIDGPLSIFCLWTLNPLDAGLVLIAGLVFVAYAGYKGSQPMQQDGANHAPGGRLRCGDKTHRMCESHSRLWDSFQADG